MEPAKARVTSEARSDATLAFLWTHGIELTPGELDPLLAEAVASLQQTIYRPDPRHDLTREEAEALERAGFELEPGPLGTDDPLARSAAQYAALIKTSLSTSDLAEVLGVEGAGPGKRTLHEPARLAAPRILAPDRRPPGRGSLILWSSLDLTGTWPTRAGASMALSSGPRPRAQRWSGRIYEAYECSL